MTVVLLLNVASLLISVRKNVCKHVFVYIYMHTYKICGFTWIGVKSEVNRFSSHIQLELCTTQVSFGSIFPSFRISIDTDLSHQKISCSKETLPSDL